jgi:hypothetical protein
MPPPGLPPLAHPISYLQPPSRTLAGNSRLTTRDSMKVYALDTECCRHSNSGERQHGGARLGCEQPLPTHAIGRAVLLQGARRLHNVDRGRSSIGVDIPGVCDGQLTQRVEKSRHIAPALKKRISLLPCKSFTTCAGRLLFFGPRVALLRGVTAESPQ